MSVPTQLFFKRPNLYGVQSAFVNIYFDLNVSESHSRTSNISDRAIEDGSIISDHIQNQLESGTLTGYVTNYSININNITTNRAQDVFDNLELLREKKILCSMLTVFKKYDNVAITDFSVDKSNSYEDITVRLSFRKVKVVKLQTVEITAGIKINTTTNNNKQANPKLNKGSQ